MAERGVIPSKFLANCADRKAYSDNKAYYKDSVVGKKTYSEAE